MASHQLDRQKLEYACLTLISFLHAQLQQRQISAMEFLSMVEQLPVKPSAMQYYSILPGLNL